MSLVTADIEAIHSEFGVAHPYAANNLLKVIRKMFNWGKGRRSCPEGSPQPRRGIVRFPERARKRFITTVEMPRFLQALEQEDNDYARHGIWLLLLMGLRCNELLKAKWEDIDWDMGTLFIGLTKNGEPLLAPISEAAMERLKIIPRISDNPYIICGKLRGQYLRGLGEPFQRTLKRAGLVNLRIHDLRRTVGSWLAQDGQSLHLIGDVLNHRDPKTTAGYAYFQTQQRRDALTGHGNRVLALTPPHLRKPCGADRNISRHACYQPPRARRSSRPRTASRATGTTSGAKICTGWCGRRPSARSPPAWVSPTWRLAKLCRRAEIPIPGGATGSGPRRARRSSRAPLRRRPRGCRSG